MKKIVYTYPHSSFLSMEKDMSLIVNMILKNDRLKKLLYYTSKDCLQQPSLTEDQSLSLFGKNIKIIPRIYVDKEVVNYIAISFDTFSQNRTNPEFRDNIIEFDIVCHYDQWQLKDFALRPYKIAAEIDSMFNEKHLTGIGNLEFISANIISMGDSCACLCLLYRAVHGEEDKKQMPNPIDESEFRENFNQLFNQ
jgi:hypothetical protein